MAHCKFDAWMQGVDLSDELMELGNASSPKHQNIVKKSFHQKNIASFEFSCCFKNSRDLNCIDHGFEFVFMILLVFRHKDPLDLPVH